MAVQGSSQCRSFDDNAVSKLIEIDENRFNARACGVYLEKLGGAGGAKRKPLEKKTEPAT